MITEADRENFADKLFLNLLNIQFAYAAASMEALQKSLDDEDAPVFITFYNLENYLNHTATMSLILWPVDKGNTRGPRLRAMLGIADDHPLKSRAARNHLQHFDETIDDWVATDDRLGYIDANLGGKAPERALRHFDPSSMIFTFRGKDYDNRSLDQAVKDVSAKVAEISEPMRPWRRRP